MENQMTPLFTDTYQNSAGASPRPMVCRGEKKVEVPQKVLRCIWDEQLIRAEALETRAGEALEIVFPGHWNFGPGPDFKNAAIKVDGKTLEGDVVLNVYRPDALPVGPGGEFENAILSVYLWEDQAPHSMAKGTPHELQLKGRLTRGILELNDTLDFDSYPVLTQYDYGRCHKPLSRLSEEKLTRLLDASGEARVQVKMDRFLDHVLARGYEQAFFEGVAEALGYPANKRPFQALARALPLARLHGRLPASAGEAEKTLILEAALLGAAGLIDLPGSGEKALPQEDQAYFRKILALWKGMREMMPERTLTRADWKFGGIRPANSPYRRIAALAALLVKHADGGLFGDFTAALKQAVAVGKGLNRTTSARLSDFFCIDGAGYFTDHYSPGGKKLARPQQLVGAARLREIVVNIAVPVGLLYARASHSEALEAALNALLSSGMRTSDNRLMRFMRHYIFGDNVRMLKAIQNDKHTQGLIQVYQDYCTQNENNCLGYSFPDVVNRNFA
jgi:hypothetical protein